MKAYIGILDQHGRLVWEENAFEYVVKQGYIGSSDVLIPWFFSGNWVEIYVMPPEGGKYQDDIEVLAAFFDE